MSLKNLFDKSLKKVLPSTNMKDVSQDIESTDLIIVRSERIKQFIPTVDYTKPANFARYGLAERYYEDSIKRIYQTYPYDGTFYEKEAWHLSSSYLDLSLIHI